MKVRTSISVTGHLLTLIDKLPNKPTRSKIIEEALKIYFKTILVQKREARDRDLLDSLSDELNTEAVDVLSYQKK